MERTAAIKQVQPELPRRRGAQLGALGSPAGPARPQGLKDLKEGPFLPSPDRRMFFMRNTECNLDTTRKLMETFRKTSHRVYLTQSTVQLDDSQE